jgi:Phosphate transport regulator (distant homolog of PhoU)
MVNYSFLKRLMVVGERQVLQKMTYYAELIESSSNYIMEMISGENENLETLAENVYEKEKEGDSLTFNLKNIITSGAIGSNLMDNFLELAETFDDILDKSYWISREVVRARNSPLFKDEREKFIRNVYSNFIDIINSNISASKLIKQILEANNLEEIRTKREEIERLEQDVDEMKDGIIDLLYKKSDSISYLAFNHLNSMVHILDDMLDGCEDVSDIVLTIVQSVSK